MTTSPERAYAPEARCSLCGTQGTVGLVARGSGVPAVQARYCFLCWPPARRAAEETWRRETAAFQDAFLAWAEAGGTSAGTPEPAEPGGLAVQPSWRGVVAEVLYGLGLTRAKQPPSDAAA